MSVKPHVVLCFALFEEENCKKRDKTLNFLPKPLSISSSLENDKICSGEGKGGKNCKVSYVITSGAKGHTSLPQPGYINLPIP